MSEEIAARTIGFIRDRAVRGQHPTYYKMHKGRRIEAIEGQRQRHGYAVGANRAFLPVFDDPAITGRIFSYAYSGVDTIIKPLPDSSVEFFRYKQKLNADKEKARKAAGEADRMTARMEQLRLRPPSPPLTEAQRKAKAKADKKKKYGLKRL